MRRFAAAILKTLPPREPEPPTPLSPTPPSVEWTISGPLPATGNYILAVAGQTASPIAIVCKQADPALAAITARRLARVPQMLDLLNHLCAILQADDEGARYADEIKLIQQELSHVH